MDAPNQPRNFKFPKRTFGIKNPELRSFNAQWFKIHPWIHYDEPADLAFCFVCKSAMNGGKIGNKKTEAAFISSGFSNCKDATKKFKKHEQSDCHKEAVERQVTLPKHTKDVGEMLSTAHTEEKINSRQQLLTTLRSIRYLARQGLALRGHDDNEGNFVQLLKLHGETNPSILSWMEKKSDKYTSPQIQNEILQVMALGLLRKVASDLKEHGFFTIMVDETTDASNREQVVLVLRHVDSDLNVHEDFIGLYMVPDIDAKTLTSVIEDTLTRMNVALKQCRGQCYDGASNMSGSKRGVAANIIQKEPRAVYTHCYGHALNWAVGDTIRGSKVLRDSLDTVHEISKLLKYSPKRDTKFEELKKEISPDTPGFRVLCPTRWTVRAASLKSVMDNNTVLQSLWEISYESSNDSEIRARLNGVKAQMCSFDFLFGVSLGYEIMRHSDNLSKTLQQKDMSASEGQCAAELTVSTLRKLRDDNEFDVFWDRLDAKLDHLDVSEPALPRRRKMPKRYESGNAPHEYHRTAKDMYRQRYYEALDMAIACIIDRFDQPGFQVYRHLQDLLIHSVTKDDIAADELDYVVNFYKDDLDRTSLVTQLESLRTLLQAQCEDTALLTVNTIVQLFKDMKPTSRAMFSDIVTVLKLILVMPATNATSERSFSALRRLKSYLRTTMTQSRLNHLMMLHVHQEATDRMSLESVAKEFVENQESRLTTFGTITDKKLSY